MALAKLPDGDERFVGLVQVFKDRIVPLLDEYFFDDRQKICLVLADNQKPEAARFISEVENHDDELIQLFGAGAHAAPSLLFPMEAVFESYVAKHLARQLATGITLKTQTQTQHLVTHNAQSWFRLKPDLLLSRGSQNLLILDTKWKLLDSAKANGREKYGLSQSDFYQLFAYGQNYLNGMGDIALIYPKTDSFTAPLPVFSFSESPALKLWVLPFCLESRQLIMPADHPLRMHFKN